MVTLLPLRSMTYSFFCKRLGSCDRIKKECGIEKSVNCVDYNYPPYLSKNEKKKKN
jgi:hypothetical protein